MSEWQCTLCDHVYDPAEGDPGSGVASGTSFEDLPDSWVCPVCEVGKNQFNEM